MHGLDRLPERSLTPPEGYEIPKPPTALDAFALLPHDSREELLIDELAGFRPDGKTSFAGDIVHALLNDHGADAVYAILNKVIQKIVDDGRTNEVWAEFCMTYLEEGRPVPKILRARNV